ncbi:MAG TPA: LysR substrate-binding domain-containing protein [Ktedonobacteraceae bacterium]|jgi:DNA-binding transcriptional LysR family regulator|nr:LysR substrate-binding domain-containing protein [Ktedonobacteraceae bacterium]
MELRHLRYFVAVAEHHNFRRAAEHLLMAQPPLSQQIHDLEKELGVQLFDRTHRQIELTVAGKVFLEDATRILAQAEQAEKRAKRASKGELGQLTIGYTSFLHCPLFPTIMYRYRTQYPDVEIVMRDLVTLEQMKQLDTNELDISFATHASLTLASEDETPLVQQCLLREPVVAVVPRNHRLAGHSPLPFAALANEPWIWFARQFDPSTYDYMTRLFDQASFRPRIVQEVNQLPIVLSLVAAGLGIGLITASTTRLSNNQEVVFLNLIDPTPIAEFNLVWRRDKHSPLVDAFLRVVKEVIAPEVREETASLAKYTAAGAD